HRESEVLAHVCSVLYLWKSLGKRGRRRAPHETQGSERELALYRESQTTPEGGWVRWATSSLIGPNGSPRNACGDAGDPRALDQGRHQRRPPADGLEHTDLSPCGEETPSRGRLEPVPYLGGRSRGVQSSHQSWRGRRLRPGLVRLALQCTDGKA